MTNRTFIQRAQGYGPTPATIQAKIDGQIVFEGEISTINQPFPTEFPTSDNLTANTVYSWIESIDFEGTRQLEIKVNNGTVLLAETLANYPPYSTVTLIPDPGNTWVGFYKFEKDGNKIYDPLSERKINGEPLVEEHAYPLLGQLWSKIDKDSTFSATINIEAGNLTSWEVLTEPGNSSQ